MTQSEVINIIKNSKTNCFKVNIGGRVVPMRLFVERNKIYCYERGSNYFHFLVGYNGYSNWSSVTPTEEDMNVKKKVMYVISNDDYNFSYLHSNGYFYNCVIDMKGCKLVSYKNFKSAENRCKNLRCAYIVEVEVGQPLDRGVVVG